jgi:imidazolonepropionase-like amidohydrolase
MRNALKVSIVLLFSLLFHHANGQNPTTTIIMNGTIHIGDGQLIEEGVVVIEQGKIKEVGTSLKNLYKNARIIDAKGKHVYPGLVCMNNIMGLNEIDAIRSTHDYNEQGEMNPNVRSLIAYNTDSKILPTAMFNGILYTQPVPQGGMISGTSSLMKTQAWNWEDAVVKQDDGVHMYWPQFSSNHEEANTEAEKQQKNIETFFIDAKAYAAQKDLPFNARLDAMKGVLTGTKNLYIHTGEAKTMIRAITFLQQNYPNVKPVIVGGQDAYLIIDFLKTNKIPVVLSNIHRLPSRNAEGIDQPYVTPSQLQKAGIMMALSYEGSWESRNLAYLAGTAAAYGMDKEAALQAITLIPAQIMGVGDKIGSIEEGKEASILIANGDLLDMKSSSLFLVFIDGKEVDLKVEQVKLYERYLKKYQLD